MRRRRKSAGRRRVRRVFARSRTHNPPRRRVRRSRRYGVFTRSRRHNPVHHRRRRHHRNPIGVSGEQILNFTGASIGLSIAQPIVKNLVGNFISLGQYSDPILMALTGIGLGKVFEMFKPLHRFGQPTMILGVSAAVVQVIQPFVSNLLSGARSAVAPAPAKSMHGWPQGYSGWNPQRIGAMRRQYRRPGMRGIGVVTGIPPTIVAPPPPAPAPAQGQQGAMSGFGMRPGVWAH